MRIPGYSAVAALLLAAPMGLADLATDKTQARDELKRAAEEGVPADQAKTLLDDVRAALQQRLGPEQRTAWETTLQHSPAETDPAKEANRIANAAFDNVELQDEQLRGLVEAVREAVRKARATPIPQAPSTYTPPDTEEKPTGIGIIRTPFEVKEPPKPAEDAFSYKGTKATEDRAYERTKRDTHYDYSMYYKRGFRGADGWGWPTSSWGGGGGGGRGGRGRMGGNWARWAHNTWTNPGAAQRRAHLNFIRNPNRGNPAAATHHWYHPQAAGGGRARGGGAGRGGRH